MLQNEEWRERAACKSYPDPRIFMYPPSRRSSREAEAAKALCLNECKVREQCLAASQWAPGIWGGLNETEREQHFKSLRRANAAANG